MLSTLPGSVISFTNLDSVRSSVYSPVESAGEMRKTLTDTNWPRNGIHLEINCNLHDGGNNPQSHTLDQVSWKERLGTTVKMLLHTCQ